MTLFVQAAALANFAVSLIVWNVFEARTEIEEAKWRRTVLKENCFNELGVLR